MYIYKITNNVNGKIYIGKQVRKSKNYMGSGLLIKRAQKKYGIENFDKVILEECINNDELCEREKYWIETLNSTDINIGYNISCGGDGGDTLSNHPNMDEISKKISDAGKGRVFTEEHRKNLSKAHKNRTSYTKRKGFTVSDETKKKLSEKAKEQWKKQKENGFEISDKSRKLISEKAKERWKRRRESGELDTEEFKNKMKELQKKSVESKKKKETKNV